MKNKPGDLSAQKLYPRKAGKIEVHHVRPQYLGGDRKGTTVPIDAAYHQEIANAFQEQHPYGNLPPLDAEVDDIMRKVYEKFPLPKQ